MSPLSCANTATAADLRSAAEHPWAEMAACSNRTSAAGNKAAPLSLMTGTARTVGGVLLCGRPHFRHGVLASAAGN